MSDSPLAADHHHLLSKTAGLWEELRGERIFITGGTGFVGMWLTEAFVAANRDHDLGARAVLLTRNPSHFLQKMPHLANEPSVSFIVGDATTFDPPKGSFSYFIHAATERTFEATAADPLAALERDRIATRRVLDFAAARGVRRFLLTSSGAVYGRRGLPIDGISEDEECAPDTTDPASTYGESKRLSEFTCAAYGRAHGFTAVISRLFAFVGPGLPLDGGYAVGNFFADILAGRPIAIGGDGTALRSYMYAADLSIWLWTMLLRGGPGKVYNTGSSTPVSIRSLADLLVQTLAPQTQVTVARAPLPGAAPSIYIPDTSRATKELQLETWITLPEALKRTFDFYRQSLGNY